MTIVFGRGKKRQFVVVPQPAALSRDEQKQLSNWFQGLIGL